MPDYDPTPWNDASTQPYDNCYDYATNNRTEAPPPPSPDPIRDHGVPGRTRRIEPVLRKRVSHPRRPGETRVQLGFECEGVKTGALLDHLDEVPVDGNCVPPCWKVAYFIKEPTWDAPGDFHFARQDSDGSWSHKMGVGAVEKLPVVPPIQPEHAPEHSDVVPGYKFCGYLCCCPGTTVVSVPRQHLKPGEVAIAVCVNRSGFPEIVDCPANSAEMVALMNGLVGQLGRPSWKEGVGPGTLAYSVRWNEYDGSEGVTITDRSITYWHDGPRYLADPHGRLAREFGSWVKDVRRHGEGCAQRAVAESLRRAMTNSNLPNGPSRMD